MKKIIFKLSLALVFALAFSSCRSLKVANVANKIMLTGIDTLELKGMSGLQAKGTVTNDYSSDVNITEGIIEVYLLDKRVGTLTQIGDLNLAQGSEVPFKTLWRISNLDTGLLAPATNSYSNSNAKNLMIDVKFKMKTKKFEKVVSREKVSLEKLASQIQL